VKKGPNLTINLPDRRDDEPDATPFQRAMLHELGADAVVVATLGVDQASELVRATVVGFAAWAAHTLADYKEYGHLNPDEPIKPFQKYYQLPDRQKGELPATAVQARILRELQVAEDVASSLGVDQATQLIHDVAKDTMEKRAVATIRRAKRMIM
jgi:hypothetical protein